MKLEVDEKETRKLSGEMGRRVLGVECPVYNKTGDICKECDRVKTLYRQDTAESRKEAGDRRAKQSFFLNVLFKDSDEPIVLKIGKKVAGKLFSSNEKYKARTGKVFGYGDPDEGEWVSISK